METNLVVYGRRQFVGHLAAGSAALAIAGTAVELEGCNATQWIQIVLNDLPTLLQIAESIIAIVGAAQGSAEAGAIAVAQKFAADAQTAIQTVQTLVTAYQSSPTATGLQKIDAALLAVQNNFAGVMSALHISNPTLQATLAAAIGSAITITVAIQALVPPPPAPAPTPAPTPVTENRAALHNSSSQALTEKVAFNMAVTAAGGAAYAIK